MSHAHIRKTSSSSTQAVSGYIQIKGGKIVLTPVLTSIPEQILNGLFLVVGSSALFSESVLSNRSIG